MSGPSASVLERARSSLKLVFTADALSMPVHWFYNPSDIPSFFPPNGITKMEACPASHPSSIMNLHSTSAGGRGAQGGGRAKEVVGDIILHGKRQFWGQRGMHYHQGLPAGENTLNGHCARLVVRLLTVQAGLYDSGRFLEAYVAFMTNPQPQHPDTYAESYHRGFFANVVAGKPLDKCGAVTHDTPSVGGLVTVAPLAVAELLRERNVARVQAACRQHLALTHPDEGLFGVCDTYVSLLDALLFRGDSTADRKKDLENCRQLIATAARRPPLPFAVEEMVKVAKRDADVVGGKYSTACYISDSWPSLLYLAYKYCDEPASAMLRNTNLGGENCHRGSVLGSIVGLCSPGTAAADALTGQLAYKAAITAEIDALLNAVAPGGSKQGSM